MPKFLIEREFPDAGKLTTEQLKAISETSCAVLSKMQSPIQWLHSYVAENKIYCIYIADNKELIIDRGNYRVNLGNILLEEEAEGLDEITVIAEVSTIQQKVDRKIINVPITDAIQTYKNVERNDPLVETALSLGVYVGELK